MTLWSILVPLIPERLAHAPTGVLGDLTRQADGHAIEVLGFYDNKKQTVGQKRNGLLALATGQYISFVDDDDAVHAEYCQRIVAAITEHLGVDLISFPQQRSVNGIPAKLCHHSAQYDRVHETVNEVWGPPTHTLVWRRALVADLRFPHASFGEDRSWWSAARERVQREITLPEVLYHYKFSANQSQTRGDQVTRADGK